MLEIFKSLVIKYLVAIHIGTMALKVKATIKLAVILSPIALVLNKVFDRFMNWGFENGDYIIVVLIAIAIDHLLGSIKHKWIDRDFTVKANLIGLVQKIGLVVACGFLFEGLHIIIDKESLVTDYLKIVVRLMVFIYPAGSAFGNSSILSGGKFPSKAFIDRINNFKNNLDPKEFTNKKEDESNN